MRGSWFGWLSAIIVTALLLYGGVTHAYSADSTQTDRIYNESVTVDYNNSTTVDKADALSVSNPGAYNVNASNSSNYTKLTEGTDYDLASDGTLTWYNTSATNDSDDATISYDYEYRSDTSTFAASLLSILVQVVVPLLMLIAGGVLVNLLFRGGF